MIVDPRFYELRDYLWRAGSYGYYWVPNDGQGEKLTWWVKIPTTDPVSKLLTNTDCYFGVHPSRIRRSEHERARSKDGDIEVINCLYFEIDCADEAAKQQALKDLDKLGFTPACVVDSGGGLHIYIFLRTPFVLDTPEKYQRAVDLQWAIVEMAGGDDSVKDLARVLRVPGTLNLKSKYAPSFPTVEIIRWDMNNQYDLADLEPLLQPYIDQRDAARAAKAHSPAPSASVSLSDAQLLDVLFKSKNGDIYQRLWNGDLSPRNGDQHKCDQLLCNGLAWVTGKDAARIDSLFQQSGLMRPKWLRKDYRERTIDNAISSAQTVYDPNHGIDLDALRAAQSAVGMGGGNSAPPPTGGATQPTGGGSGLSMDQFLLAQGPNDEGNAQSVYALYGSNFVYCDAYGFLRYNGQFWESHGAEAALTRAIVHTLQRRAILGLMNSQDALLKAAKPSASNVKACLYLFQSLVTVSVENFDADPESLNCGNGVVNLRTGQLTAHTPSQRFTYCVPVNYNPTADYIEWIEFLAKVTTHHDMVDYLQMAVGYTATGYTREECMFYIYGPSRSGKGTFSETLLSILPKPLGVQADFSTFTAERKGDMQNFDLAPLKPARFVVASESNKYDTLNEAKIKTATGGDWIRCAFKHRDHFEYRPQFKIWLVSNHPIKGDVDDDAFWGRAKVIEFPHSFLGKEDKTLKQRMKKPAILEGVLRWMVDGAIAWFAATGGLNPPQAVIDATAARRRDLDYVQQWLDECCKVDPAAWTTNSDLRTSYESWCKAEGTTPKGPEQFARALSQKGFAVGIRNRTPLGKQARGVQGLSII